MTADTRCMSIQELWTRADPLGEALHLLRMTGSFYCRSLLTAPWAVSMPAAPGCLWFHVVTRGECTLQMNGRAQVRLTAGDFALVPHGRGHRLQTARNLTAPDVTTLPQEMVTDHYSLLEHGQGGAATRLVCGLVRFDAASAGDLVRLLPPLIHLATQATPQLRAMRRTLKLMSAEARQLRPGGETVLTRLSDVLVMQAIRAWLERDPSAQTGWLGALRDKQIGRAIVLVQRAPERSWTVAALADEVGMSRSAFAAAFSALVGETPMHYVTRVRMRLALGALREQRVTVAELAASFGYQSEAAFSRAFKRVLGMPPGEARHATLATSRTSPRADRGAGVRGQRAVRGDLM